MRIVRLLGVIALFVLIITACSPESTPVTGNDTANNIPSAQNVAQNDAGSSSVTVSEGLPDIVARVNGEDITREEFVSAMAASPLSVSAVSQQALEQEVLYQLILQELILQSAPELGINVTDEQVQEEIDLLKGEAVSEDVWQQWMQQNGFTDESTLFAAQREALITQRVRDTLLADYLGEIEQVNARHIVVPTLEQAEEILARLNNGEGFAELSAEYSLDTTTRNRGGNLGWFARNELFYPRLEEIAFQLEPGSSAGPVETSLGFHIIQTLAKEVRPVEPERLPMLANNIFTTWLEGKYNNATVEQFIEW